MIPIVPWYPSLMGILDVLAGIFKGGGHRHRHDKHHHHSGRMSPAELETKLAQIDAELANPDSKLSPKQKELMLVSRANILKELGR